MKKLILFLICSNILFAESLTECKGNYQKDFATLKTTSRKLLNESFENLDQYIYSTIKVGKDLNPSDFFTHKNEVSLLLNRLGHLLDKYIKKYQDLETNLDHIIYFHTSEVGNFMEDLRFIKKSTLNILRRYKNLKREIIPISNITFEVCEGDVKDDLISMKKEISNLTSLKNYIYYNENYDIEHIEKFKNKLEEVDAKIDHLVYFHSQSLNLEEINTVRELKETIINLKYKFF